MLQAYFPILGVVFGGGLALSAALVLGARYGPHRLWSLAMFIAGIALIVNKRVGDFGVLIMTDEMSGFALALNAVAYASFASALTIQCLRAWRTSTPWQVGAGTVAAEATLLTGVEILGGC